MPGNSRQVEFDLLVTGTEAGGAKVERLGGKFDELRRKVERLDGTTARVRAFAKIEHDSDRLSTKLRDLTAGFASTVKMGLAPFGNWLSLAAGAVGPLTLATITATKAIVAFTTQAAMAANALVPIGIGAVFVTKTVKAMGEAFTQAFEPMADAWEKSTAAAGRLATKGLDPLVRKFVRVNFPAIADAQERIGRSLNGVVKGYLEWQNSAPGIETIRRLTSDAAGAFEELAPQVRGVAQSLLMMASRISQVSFNHFTDGVSAALTKLNAWIDRVDAGDVARGFDRLQQLASNVARGFRAIGDAVDWLETNRQKILHFSDALLGLTAAGAALTGAWPVALGATLLLLARHWDDVTGAVTRVRDAITSLPQKFSSLQGTLDAFGVAWAAIKTGFRDFVATVGPKMGPLLDEMRETFIEIQPAVAGAVTVLGAFIEACFQVAGPIVSGMIGALTRMIDVFGDVALGTSDMVAKMLGAFADLVQPIATLAKKLKLPFADALQSMVDGARNAQGRINQSMAQVKTDKARTEIDRLREKIRVLKGKRVQTDTDRKAIADSIARIRALQAQINSLHGKTVITRNITEYQSYRSGERGDAPRTGSRTRPRAVGGPVMAGRSYVVGDRGRPELFVPKQDGRILPRVPSGWGRGGGTARVVLLVQSDGGRYGDFMVEELRRVVRVKGGGNVQRALGRA